MNTLEKSISPVRIENWSMVNEPGIPSILYFHGNFFGHPRLAEGEEGTTSEILRYRDSTQTFVCLSREYYLGSIDPDYEKAQPDALAKILQNIIHVE